MNTALFSECRTYRYVLTRDTQVPLRWVRPMLFIMLNPSTADATKNDPTIHRCIYFAERFGATSLTVVNLFALRATDPRKLKKHKDPVGPENDAFVQSEIERHSRSGVVVAAWGANPMAKFRGSEIIDMNAEHARILCLGVTKSGAPRHPLYVKNDQPLVEYV